MKQLMQIAGAGTILFLSLSPLALAQGIVGSATGTPRNLIRERMEAVQEKRADVRENVQEKREDVRENVQEKRADVRAKINDVLKTRIDRLAEQMFKRFAAAIERLETLSARIDERIKKLEENGRNLSNAKALLAEANTAIADAKTKLESAKAALETTVSATDPKEAFKNVRELLSVVKESVKKAHAKLVDTIRAIKASVPASELDNESTTTQ